MKLAVTDLKLFLESEVSLCTMFQQAAERDVMSAMVSVETRVKFAITNIQNRLLMGYRFVTQDLSLISQLSAYFICKRCRPEDLERVERDGGGYVIVIDGENAEIREYQRPRDCEANTRDLYSTRYLVGLK